MTIQIPTSKQSKLIRNSGIEQTKPKTSFSFQEYVSVRIKNI